MNNGEKNLKNAEVANEKIQQEKRVKKVNHIGLYENRELSWLKFNERVLEEAEDTSVPLCERMTFLSIFQSNLDEFFMCRFVGGSEAVKPETPGEQDKYDSGRADRGNLKTSCRTKRKKGCRLCFHYEGGW